MKRRTFFKTTAAIFGSAMVSPVVQRPDLTPWCDAESFRWDLANPFGQGEYTYATDCRACVRVNGIWVPSDANAKVPEADGLFWDVFDDRNLIWQPMDNARYQTIASRGSMACPNCFKRPGRPATCEDDYYHPRFDPDSGEIAPACHLCKDGCKVVRRADGSVISAYYGRLLDELGDVEVCKVGRSQLESVQACLHTYEDTRPGYWQYTSPGDCVAFRTDRMQGLIMPIDVKATK